MKNKLLGLFLVFILLNCSFDSFAQSCAEPTNLGVTNRTQTSVDVYWTPGSGSNIRWQVRYGQWPSSTSITLLSFNDTLSLTGLEPGQPYFFYVREECTGGGNSDWAGQYVFPTLCPANSTGDSITDPVTISSLPYSQSRLMSCFTNKGGTFSDPDIYYKYTTAADAVGLTIEASGETSTDDTYLELFDANGTSLISNNDISGANRFSRIRNYPVSPNTEYFILSESILNATASILLTEVSESCEEVSAPYIQDFESGFVDGYHDGLDECWTFWSNNTGSGNSGFSWEVTDDLASTVSGTGADRDNTLAPATGGKFITIVSDGSSSTSDTAMLLTPFVDLSSLTDPELSFFYHRYGQSLFMPDLVVDIYHNSSWALNAQTISSLPQTSRSDAYSRATVNLSAYSGQTIRVRFRVISKGFGLLGDMALDDIRFDNSCAKPTQLTAGNITTSSADLSWTSGGASHWKIQVGASGFSPSGSGTVVSSMPYTATGLSPETDYDFYVRDSCGLAELSLWSGPYTFTTACPASYSAPYAETFEDFTNEHYTGTERCWDFSSNNAGLGINGFSWQSTNQKIAVLDLTGADRDHTLAPAMGGTFITLVVTGSSSTSDSTMFTSPVIDLSSLTAPRLRYYYHRYGVSTFMPDLHVDIHNGSTWTLNAQLITTAPQSSQSDAYTESTVDLSAYAGQSIQVRFRAISKGFGLNGDISIDDVYIENDIRTFSPASGNSGSYHDANNWSPVGIPGNDALITINAGDTCNVTSSISGSWNTLTLNGVIDMNSNQMPSITTLSGSGSVHTNYSGSNPIPTGKTWNSVTYETSTTQVSTGTYTNLSVTGSGTKSLNGNVSVSSQLTVGTNATLNENGHQLTIGP